MRGENLKGRTDHAAFVGREVLDDADARLAVQRRARVGRRVPVGDAVRGGRRGRGESARRRVVAANLAGDDAESPRGGGVIAKTPRPSTYFPRRLADEKSSAPAAGTGSRPPRRASRRASNLRKRTPSRSWRGSACPACAGPKHVVAVPSRLARSPERPVDVFGGDISGRVPARAPGRPPQGTKTSAFTRFSIESRDAESSATTPLAPSFDLENDAMPSDASTRRRSSSRSRPSGSSATPVPAGTAFKTRRSWYEAAFDAASFERETIRRYSPGAAFDAAPNAVRDADHRRALAVAE